MEWMDISAVSTARFEYKSLFHLWSQATLWMSAAARISELEVSSVDDMVGQVLGRLKPGNIMNGLFLVGHGSADRIQIGDDWIDLEDPQTDAHLRAVLRRLGSRMSVDYGFVHLVHCKIGQNAAFVSEMAKAFGVTVYAGTGFQHGFWGFNTGKYVKATRDGTFTSDVGRPRPIGLGG